VCDEDELETGLKVVAIMQTIAEEHDESSKKMFRKLLGIPEEHPEKTDETTESST
jgi:hypothetical protein